MRVFVTGASGFVGRAVTEELIGNGHEVVGLARSEQSAQLLTKMGASVAYGDLHNHKILKENAQATDATIHLGFIHDFANWDECLRVDAAAIAAMASVLKGSGKSFVAASAVGGLPGNPITEQTTAAPDSFGAERHNNAESVIALAKEGVHSSIVRLGTTVHDQGDPMFVAQLIALAREKGFSGYVDDGTNSWPAVHRLDGAHLFVLALDPKVPSGTRLHAVAETVTLREIAETIGRQLSIPAKSVPAAQAQEHFGFLSMFVGLDVVSTSDATRKISGWEPRQISLIQDLELGHYFKQPSKP